MGADFWTEKQMASSAYPTDVATKLAEHATDDKTHEVWGANASIIVLAEGNVEVTFSYKGWSGSNLGMTILGVDVVDGEGNVVKGDYHVGFAGGTPSNNVYTLAGVPVGNYTIRYFVCNRTDGDHKLDRTAGKVLVKGANLPVVTSLDETKVYRLKSGHADFYLEIADFAQSSGEGALQFKKKANNSGQFFALEKTTDGQYHLKSVKDGTIYYVNANTWNFFAKTTAPEEGFSVYNIGNNRYAFLQTYAMHNGGDQHGYLGNTSGASEKGEIYNNQPYNAEDGISWIFEEVNVAVLKATAKEELDNLAKLTAVYPDATSAKGEIDNVTGGSSLVEVETAVKQMDQIIVNYKKLADGKDLKFTNHGSGDRNGRYLGYDKPNTRAAAVASSGDDVIWTLKVQENGSFKLYNFVHNVYLGVPADPTPVITTEKDAPAFDFIVTDNNKAALVTGDKMVHVANHTNYKLIQYYSTSDGASLWTIAQAGNIVVTRDQYDSAAAARLSLPYAMQQAYGITDATKYTSNAKATEEGSYAGLIDGVYNDPSHFHSAYNTTPGDYHYLQVELNSSIQDFYFYFKKRQGNNNNRPTEIDIMGSADGNDFTLIKTINSGLPTDANIIEYMSDEVNATENIKYVRFVVKATNNGSKDSGGNYPFFTFSEFYVIPATPYVKQLLDAYNNFMTSSITSDAMASAATALIEAENTLALYNIKKEADALLTANADKHVAEDPALGEYLTAAYDALRNAYTCGTTEAEIRTAIDNFNKSLNKPVYIITSAWDAGYPAGSAIYYDGEWKWKKSNRYDKQMWMTLPGYIEEAVPAAVDAYDANNPSYGFCDYLTGTKMRGKDVQIVKVPNWEGAYSLQYAANAESTDAAQHAANTGKLVNWKTALANDRQASAWRVEYVGNTYDLDQLVDEQLQALTGLQNAFDSKVYLFDAVVGDGIGQYKDDNGTLSTMLQDLFDMIPILNENLSNLNDLEMTIGEINATAEKFNSFTVEANMPEDGKYYRIYGANQVIPQGYYITGHTNADGGRIALTAEADASTIYYYKDTHLQAYQSGKYIALNNDHYTFDKPAEGDKAAITASVITFAASPRVAGAYTIMSADRYLHYKSISETEVEVDRCGSDEALRHDWYLVEVEKQTITYIYKAGETELARQTVTEFAGMPYPASNVTLPWGYTVPTDALTGNIPVGETEKVIECTLSLPFQFADSYEAIETNGFWYYLKFDSKNNYYLYHTAGQNYIALDSKDTKWKNKDLYSWGFVGDPINGFKIVNKAAGSTMILSSSTTMAGETGADTWPIMTVEVGLPEGNNTYWIPTDASTHASNGFFLAQKDHPSNRLNNRGKLAYWTGGAGTGSTFVVEARPFGPAAELAELLSEAEELKAVVDANTGDKIGEYSEATATALDNAITTAKGVAEATADDVTALEDVVLGIKITLPTADTYYQIHSALFTETKAVYSNGSAPMWKALNEYDRSFYWKAVETADGGIALQNAQDNNKYMNGASNQSGAWTVSDTPSAIDVKILTKDAHDKGYQYGIILNNWQLHANGHNNGNGTSGNIVSYNSDKNSASAWYLVEAELPSFYPVTYKFNYEDDTKYTQEKLVAIGGTYPEMDVFLPYGVTSNFELPAGTVQAASEHVFELTVNKALPLEAAADVNSITKWYYVQMHANPAVTAYLEDKNGTNIAWNNKYVDDSEIESHLWGFVGDVWTGIKVVNKATERAIVSTSGNAVLGDAANATAFIPAISNGVLSDWFCLKYPESNYLNAQGDQEKEQGIVASYQNADNGSSLFVTESDKSYSLNMSTGYATFYSQYRVAIPEDVEAWVVSSVENNEVVLDEVDGDILPANTGVILKGTGTPSIVTSAAATANVGTNLLQGTVTKTLIEAAVNTSYYVLANGVNGVKLYKAKLNKNEAGETVENGTHFYNNANKVYLPVETPVVEENGEPAQALSFRFRGKGQGTTEIEVPATNDQQPAVIYDLTGRRITEIVEKGIYIVNGKKVLF